MFGDLWMLKNSQKMRYNKENKMIKSIIFIIIWFILIFASYKFIKLNINQVEENEDRYFKK